MNIILAYEKFKNDLVDLVNHSGLPMAMMQTVMEQALVQINQAAIQQLAKAQHEEEKAKQEAEKAGGAETSSENS